MRTFLLELRKRDERNQIDSQWILKKSWDGGTVCEKGNRWYPKKEKGGTRYFHMDETFEAI